MPWPFDRNPPISGGPCRAELSSAEFHEANLARREQRRPRALQELDFLLGVQDITRMGGLRFRSAGRAPYLDNSENAVPPVTSLRELAGISRRMQEPGTEELPEYERWLATLIAQ